MNQEIELELTFLAKEIPAEIKDTNPIQVKDIYIPDIPEHSHLRLRKKGNKYEITKKHPAAEDDVSIQIENTIPLTEDEYNVLSTVSNKSVTKNRYSVPYSNAKMEVDVFTEKLSGLVLIDFEFKTVEEKNNFVVPDFALVEVTPEEFVAGGMLAGKSYEDIEDELKRFDYKKL